jgi:hypothetical protein
MKMEIKIEELIKKYKSEKEKMISWNKEVGIDYKNGQYETQCDYVYDDTKGTYKLMMIIQILEDLENLTIS